MGFWVFLGREAANSSEAATQDKPGVTEGNPWKVKKIYRATTVAALKTACAATVVALYFIYNYRGFLRALTLASVTHGLSWVAASLLFAASRPKNSQNL